MRREDLVNLKDKIKNKEVKMYSSTAAFDYINNETIQSNRFFYDYQLLADIDKSEDLSYKILKTLEELMGKVSFIYENFDSIDFIIIPKLLFDINTITDKTAAVVDNPKLEYQNKYIDLSIVFLTKIDGQYFEIPDVILEGIVDYNKFYTIMSKLGFNLPYTNMNELSCSIMECAKNETFPKFMISLNEEPNKKIK